MTRPPEHATNGDSHRAHRRADVLDLVDAGFRYAFSLTHHRQDAEDLIQQACLRVVRTRGTSVEKAYLFVTIRNLFRDNCRRQSRVSFAPLTDESSSTGDSEVSQIEIRMDLESMLSTLSCDERELLYLNCIEGFTAQEISDITGRPRGTILSNLSRTRQKLSDRFRVTAREGQGAP